MKTKAEETKEMRKKALKEARKNTENGLLDECLKDLDIGNKKEGDEEKINSSEIIDELKNN